MPEVFAHLEINLRYSYRDGEGIDWYTVDMRFVTPIVKLKPVRCQQINRSWWFPF